MKEVTVTCDRCGKVVHGGIDEWMGKTITAGYYDVSEGYWSKYKRWEEEKICDECMQNDPRYKATYSPEPPK
jgi:hypothetical protein